MEEKVNKNQTRGKGLEKPEENVQLNLTSVSVFELWTLLASQISCTFCLSWDRVSCTDFKDASTVEGEDINEKNEKSQFFLLSSALFSLQVVY